MFLVKRELRGDVFLSNLELLFFYFFSPKPLALKLYILKGFSVIFFVAEQPKVYFSILSQLAG